MKRLDARFQKNLGPFRLDVQLSMGAEILALFGSSGAGKTRTLECIAGLARPETGHIVLNDRTLFRRDAGIKPRWVPARQRGVGYAFQDGALFPHLSAFENVRYGPRRRGDPHSAKRTQELLETFGIASLASSRIHELSGGQLRRVSIARAVAAAQNLLLLDEPLVHLDRTVRSKLMDDLQTSLRARELPTIIVTHDVDVVARLADRVAVIEQGRIAQVGTVGEVLFTPSSTGIARLLGDVSILSGIVRGTERGLWTVQVGQTTWRVPYVGELFAGDAVELMIRASAVKALRDGEPIPAELGINRHEALVRHVDPRPEMTRVRLELAGGLELVATFPPGRWQRRHPRGEDHCAISVDLWGLELFPLPASPSRSSENTPRFVRPPHVFVSRND